MTLNKDPHEPTSIIWLLKWTKENSAHFSDDNDKKCIKPNKKTAIIVIFIFT